MRLLALLRLPIVLMFAALLSAAPLQAEDALAEPVGWQSVISGQIQAFRDHDPDAALSYAGATFHETFTDARKFYFVIMTTGYLPIITSRSHTFGSFEMVGTDSVMQNVTFVDADQSLYQAVYLLKVEADGWRVEGVQLVKKPGVAI